MKKTFLSLGLALSLVLGGTAAQAASAADTDGIVFFTGNSSVLGVKAKKEIKAFVQANPNAASFAVTGYVQKAGSDRNNSKLSLARANAVKKYIAKLGNTKTVAVTAGGISPTRSKTTSARRAVLTAVAPVAAAPTPSASATPASYDVSLKSSTVFGAGSFTSTNFSPMNGVQYPDITALRALITFDYVKPDGSASASNTLPATVSDLATFQVKPDSNVTVRIADSAPYTPLLNVSSLPACVEFVSATNLQGGNALLAEAYFKSITVRVISTNCTIEASPGLPLDL